MTTRLRLKQLRFGTWNIRTLATPGASDILAEELNKYKMDVVALQETRWPFAGRINTEKYLIYYSGSDDNRYYGGVGFAVRKKIADAVIHFEAINERLGNIRLRGKFHNISLVSFYAPTEDSDDEEKDQFYDTLDELVGKLPSFDMKIVLGDANAKVGREQIWKTAIGNHSLHQESNDNGTRLASFALSNDYKISSTMFPRKDIHKYTWTSPNGLTKNQIDHVLVDQRHKSSITDVKSVRGAECGTDHSLILVKVNQRIAIQRRKEEIQERRIDTERLELNRVAKEFKIKLENRFRVLEDIDGNEDINSNWTNFKIAILDSAEEVCGKKTKRNKKPWFDHECEQMLEERIKRKKAWMNSNNMEAKERYNQANRDANKLLKRKKRLYINSLLEKAEEENTANNAKDFYRKIRYFKKGFTPRTYGVKNKEGNMLTEKQQVIERWREYFYELLNVKKRDETTNQNEEITYYHVQPNVEPPTREEVKNAVKALKSNKAPGKDEITAEILKKGGNVVTEKLWDIMLKIWEKEEIPAEWQEAVVVPIHKKGEKEECGNYRGISLLSIPYKVISKIILNRLEHYSNEVIGDHQAGFIKGRSTTNQIFMLKEIVAKYWEYNKEFFAVFIDFQKAYDSIIREKLWSQLEKFGIPRKLINLIRMTVTGSRCSVRINGCNCEPFEINSGVRQGDGLSPILFNIAIEEAMQIISQIDLGVKVGAKVNILAFADDVVILAESFEDVKTLTKVFIKEAGKVGLKTNDKKTKYMHFTRNQNHREGSLQVDGHEFDHVHEFKYLGVIISNRNTDELEIQNRINSANKCFYACSRILASKSLSHKTKIRLYKAIICPVLLYGSETWKLNKKEEKQLIVFENRVLRKIYGPTCEQGEWRRKHNREIRDLYNRPDIISEIKCRRIRWAGHLLRREEEFRLKKVMKSNPEGSRPRGRPKRRWWNQVRADMEKVGAAEEDAEDRIRWRGFVGAAKYQLRYKWPWE